MPQSEREMANICLSSGFVVGAQHALPDDPTLYAWPGRERGCTNLRCVRCASEVRSDAGWEWSSEVRPDVEALLGAGDLDGQPSLRRSERGRLYRCGCTAHVEVEVASIAQYRESQRSSIGEKWACAGHAPVELPARVDGIEIDPGRGGAGAWVRAALVGEDFEEAVQRLVDLFFRLAGTSVESALTMAVAALVSDDEPRLRDAAILFYAAAPFVVGAERVGIWAAEQPSMFAGESHWRRRDRWTTALIVAVRAVEAGRPYEPPVQELLRREALTEAQASRLVDFLAWNDRDWFVANAARFPSEVHERVEELLRYRATPEELAEYGRRRAAPPRA